MSFDLGSGSDVASTKISDILREVSSIDDFSKKLLKLDFHVHALEQELNKIEAFKRELPHCMHLLKDAIERLKEESRREVGPVVEEGFRNYYGEGDERAKASNHDFFEKRNWMSSVQLSTPISRNQHTVFHLRSRFLEGDGSGNGSKFRNDGGAFLPFKKPTVVITNGKQGTAPVEGFLSLAVPEADVASNDLTTEGDYGFVKTKLQQPHQQEQQKKQRRCWTPELHKIFVDALRRLGGAESATPKQIRELMKVEGLTNDEVKSHLQKYRIHIKRVETASSGGSFAISGWSPQGPLHRDEEDDKSESHGWKTKLHIPL